MPSTPASALSSSSPAAPHGRHRRGRGRLASVLSATALALAGSAVAAGPADAAVTSTQRTKALSVAAAQAGDPYRWGAAGPSAFDCSGLTQYAYGKAGRYLPHRARSQVSYTTRVSTPRPGDLVFIYDSSGVYHVGLYAGNGYMWHAPRSGDVVKKGRIWTSRHFYGRVK